MTPVITSATVSMIVATEAIRERYDGNTAIDQERYQKIMADREAQIQARPDYNAAMDRLAEIKNVRRIT